MTTPLTLKIITPERIVLEQPVDEVSATAIDGQFAVLPGHIPLVTALANDVLSYKSGGTESIVAVLGGILEVSNNTVTILSDAAELASEIDEARARQAKERAEAEKSQKVDKLDVYTAEMSFSRAAARLKALKIAETTRHRRGKDHI
jgi:F-type H+-transporting ATPase subunit epsilon